MLLIHITGIVRLYRPYDDYNVYHNDDHDNDYVTATEREADRSAAHS